MAEKKQKVNIIKAKIIVSEIIICLSGVEEIELGKPAVFDFYCDISGNPKGAVGVHNKWTWLGLNKRNIEEHFSKKHFAVIKRHCKKAAKKILKDLGDCESKSNVQYKK